MREIVFDTETTGLSPADGDRITEIGCVEVIDFVPTGREYHCYVNPQRSLPPKVTEITGLTDEFLADKPLFADVVEDFMEFVGDARMVAHNAEFDKGFVNAELNRHGRSVLPHERFHCTLVMARKKFPGVRNSLDSLCDRFRISLETRDVHGALVDARLLAKVYLELNGGRERRLDIFEKTGGGDSGLVAKAPPRPEALPSLVTERERAAHSAFIEEMGENALWSLYNV
ncbi:MAG: DNA polymerase III subunit epsilon [Euryhalocaulis sp.]|uniref:DNA polymerase III subunit epsilon n=1 Tax=Euryhalocaulis sp. TaxID=2744307 RepID=UPI001810D798|nr:DNA polymerase III subunit epsilon [Euryhalocaulis sp.]MBA4801514.1 DNA polymerase III subunit epsilon [Euryhalocaulis sp.]